MKTKTRSISPFCQLAVLAAMLAPSGNALAAPVTEQEALEIAEFWYPAEINHYDEQGWDRGPERKSDLLAAVQVISIRYLIDKDTIVSKLKRRQQPFAYIIEFAPRGHLVLAADDSITPLLAFNINSDFEWDNPEGLEEPTFMRLFLNSFVADARTYLNDLAASGDSGTVSAGWSGLRFLSSEQTGIEPVNKTFSTAASVTSMEAMAGTPDPSSAEVILPTATWAQTHPYNDAVTDAVVWMRSGSPPDGYPESVVTGCSATGLAIVLTELPF